MKKAIFNYKKEDGSIKERMVFEPVLLKESSNILQKIDNPNVKYLSGYELNKTGLDDSAVIEYEKIIQQYLNIEFPTLESFLEDNGLDPTKLQKKSFKKECISDLQILA